jgi:proteasome lid subunit RPN8/RPN11
VWRQLLTALRERGGYVREAGAFLLGRKVGDARLISHFLLYDDVDPNALQGMIVFDGSRMDRVWARCAELDLDVVADVHTHPGGYGQSLTDQANPMIPRRGHLALIVPHFARREFRPGEIGIYEFQGLDGWLDHSRQGDRFFQLT